MWREPSIENIDVPNEYKGIINTGIFYNRKGIMRNASDAVIYQNIIALFFGSIMLGGMISILVSLIFQIPTGLQFNLTTVIITSITLIFAAAWFVYWGWYIYEEAWYHFDEENEMLTIIRRHDDDWEIFDIPYSTVNKVEWSGGKNGFARIYAADFTFDTTRAGTDRFASVTELWPKLARFDTKMSNWPIILICPECDREFGHHIGTAQCPFDEMLLIDPEIKGRIDPEEIHPDDRERV